MYMPEVYYYHTDHYYVVRDDYYSEVWMVYLVPLLVGLLISCVACRPAPPPITVASPLIGKAVPS